MRRRDLIAMIVGAVATWPLPADAQQQPKTPVIGFLNSASPRAFAHRVEVFRQARPQSWQWACAAHSVTPEYLLNGRRK